MELLAGTVAKNARPHVISLRVGPIAFRVNLRCVLYIAVALAVLSLMAAWAMTLGSYPVPLTGVVETTLGLGSGEYDFVVRELRLPRILTAILVGALLAGSGAIFQGVVRNPLVSPDIIGINAGASLAAVWWIVSLHDRNLLPLVAFAGATSAATAIYLLSWRGGISPGRLVLIGIGINAMLSAVITFLMTRYPIEQVSSAVLWTTGSVYASSWEDVWILGLAALVLLPLSAALMFPLRMLQFGDDMARNAGIRVEITRVGLLAAGCALAAAAVSIAGPIGFVAFVVPHMARMIAGPITGAVLLFAVILGGMLVLGSDMLAQHALPVSLPVGVVTAGLGAPYFLYLLYRGEARL